LTQKDPRGFGLPSLAGASFGAAGFVEPAL
jgi:hypothetical protein